MHHSKESIFLWTVAIIMEKGIHNASIWSIAKHISMSQWNIYNHFSSKEDLINEAYFRIKQQEKEYISAWYNPNETIKERFIFLYQKLFSFYFLHQDYYNFIQQTFLIKIIKNDIIEQSNSKVFIDLYKDGQKEAIFFQWSIDLQMIMARWVISSVIKNCITKAIQISSLEQKHIITSIWYLIHKQ